MASSRADESSNGQGSNGNSQQKEDAPWTFGGVPGGNPFSQGSHHGVEFPTRERFAGAAGTVGAGSGNILYHANGTIIANPKIYVIWYGTWAGTPCTETSTASTPGIINYFLQNVGGSAWNAINTTYYQTINGVVTYVPPTAPWSGCFVDPGSQGFTLDGYSTVTPGLKLIDNVVSNALALNAFGPADPNGVYFVLTSANVVVNGFVNSSLKSYCGYHDSLVSGTTTVKFSFVGDPGTNIASCAGQTAASPNGNVNADAMTSVIAHELVEAVSDPLGNSWFDAAGYENADKCAWTFGTTTSVGSAKQNTTVGGRPYLIQQNVAANTNTCLMTAPAAAAPKISSFSPTFGPSITITGTNLLRATSVSFNGTAGTNVTVVSATSVTVTPPASGTSGKITITTPGGTSAASSANYYFPAGPITAPATAVVGSTITITGTNLLGATAVNFIGTTTITATPTVATSGLSLTVKVPTGATSGSITVKTPAGVSTASPVLIAPTIASFTPTNGTRNAATLYKVTITGTNFAGATSVTLTGVSGVAYTVVSPTSITATFLLPTTLATSTTAKFTVVTPAGSVTSTGSFTIK